MNAPAALDGHTKVVLRILVFDALIILCCSYALLRGGAPERICGCALLIAYAATLASYSALPIRFYRLELRIFAVDLALLFVLVAVALRADRRWPLLLAGLQLATVTMHLLKLRYEDIIRVVYAFTIAIAAYPMIVALAVGTWRHQRRLMVQGYDRPWTMRDES